MRMTSVTVRVILRKCHSQCYSITSMFKVHYQQLIHFFYGNVSNILILSWAVIMKRKSAKVPIIRHKYQLHKHSSLHFEEHCTYIEQTFHLFLLASFSPQ